MLLGVEILLGSDAVVGVDALSPESCRDESRTRRDLVPVSYTHLTLPTIYSV